MMTADAAWLSAIALGYLVSINAVANGCRLALRDTAASVDWPSNLARGIAAAATGTTTKARKASRETRPRRMRSRKKSTPRIAVTLPEYWS
jgi:hypothetical protein